MRPEDSAVIIPIVTSKEFIAKFWSKTSVGHPSDCWDWIPKPFRNGYGHLPFQRNGKRRMIGCHRISFIIKNGAIPEGKHILHSCDNRRCVNPEHLSAGSSLENMRQMWARGRGVTHSQPGASNPSSKLTQDQVEAILILRESGWFYKDIAKRFGVSDTAIRYVAIGRTWKNYSREWR